MKQNLPENYSQPTIIRYSTSMNGGVEAINISRHAIGYVVRGDKYIYDGDTCLHAERGDMFFLNKGLHHVEDIAEKNSHFEQVIFYFTAEELKRIVTTFSITYNMNITNEHSCSQCRKSSSITLKSPQYLRNFFNNVLTYLYEEDFVHDNTAESIKLTELIYLILSHEDCCIKNKVIGCIDTEKTTFEQIIYANTFNDISIDDLAGLCNRSLTSFKKEFKRIFDIPPHQWFLRQRLNFSRLLLISTSKSVAEIGSECSFPNTSHFIKLFKRSYLDTPATYRNKHKHTSQYNSSNIN